MTNPALNDSLEDLIAGDRTERPAPPAVYEAVAARYTEPCSKCRGTGSYRGFGRCFACKGVGQFTFKTSPETRAAGRDAAANRKARTAETEAAERAAAVEAWKAANPAAYAWLIANVDRSEFATSLWNKLRHWGSLTPGQLGAIEGSIARDADRKAERAARDAAAPAIDTAGIDRLKLAFDKARAHAAAKATGLTVRNPKITIGGITISPAKATSANAGALYVKSGDQYLGKIMDGRLMAVSACTPAQREQILKFVSDPAQAAKVYGQETGVCCVCNATLRSEWRLRGIGPICAEKMGW